MLTRAMAISIIEDEVFVDGPENRIYGIEEAAAAILAEMDEPLWELADRKNCWIETHQNRNLSKRILVYANQQVTGLDHVDPKEFRAPTYAQAEQAAREYLNSLPDTKEVG